MSTPTPTTPEQAPRQFAALSRSFTLPSRLGPSQKPPAKPEIGAKEGVETLYVHPNAKILKFNTSSNSRPSTGSASASSPGGQQGHGVLPWASPSERTMAIGPLEIYRVPGSVSFLHSGSLLHAIMPKSQCWCVDGVSKFAMRVLTDTYYRIELPGDTPEELNKVEELKETLKKVLSYERVACPFARTFTVELPTEPEVQKRRRRSHGPAKRWRLEKAYGWKPEDGGEAPVDGDDDVMDGSPSTSGSDEGSSTPQEGDSSEELEQVDKVRELNFSTPSRPTVRERVRDFSARRSFTAPVPTAFQSTPPSRLRSPTGSDAVSEEPTTQLPSITARQEGVEVRTVQAILTAMPPSPPDSSAGYDLVESHLLAADVAESPAKSPSEPFVPNTHAVTQDLARDDIEVIHPGFAQPRVDHEDVEAETFTASVLQASNDDEPANFRTPHDEEPSSNNVLRMGNVVDANAISEQVNLPKESTDEDPDPFAQIQARIQARRSIGGTNDPRLGSYSPYATPSKSLASRRPVPRRQTSQQNQALTAALINKACAVFFGPPAHLVRIMLRIAARFADGTFARTLFTNPTDESERVPGTFDLDDSDIDDIQSDAEVEEDDFGVPLQSPIRLAAKAETMSRGIDSSASAGLRDRRGWEVD